MPYVSDAQRKFFHAAEKRGEMSHDTVEHWDKATKGKKLPEHVKKKETEKCEFSKNGQWNLKKSQPVDKLDTLQKTLEVFKEILEKERQGTNLSRGEKNKFDPSRKAKKRKIKQKRNMHRNKYYSDNLPNQQRSAQQLESDLASRNQQQLKHKVDVLKSEDDKLDTLKKSLESIQELIKSNYGPKGGGQYTPADNAKRKEKNVEEDVIEGPNKNAKRYTSAVKGTAKEQAAKEARQMKAASKKNPVKVYSPEELASFARARGMNVSTKKCEFDKNGQWKMKKESGSIGGADVSGSIGGGLPLGAANKTDK